MRRMRVVLVLMCAAVALAACGSGDGDDGGEADAAGSSESSLISDAEDLVEACRASDEVEGSGVCEDLAGFEDLCRSLDPSLSPDGVLIVADQAPQPASIECRGDDTTVHVAFLNETGPDPCDDGLDCTDEIDGISVARQGAAFVFVGDGVLVDVIGEDVSEMATSVANAAFGIDVEL